MQSFILSFSFLLLFSIGTNNKEKTVIEFQNIKQKDFNERMSKDSKKLEVLNCYPLICKN